MELQNRKSTRIPGYDYSNPNYYFITICTNKKKCIFGSVNELNELGKIAKRDLQEIATHFENVRVDNYIIMPNHVHAIIVIESSSLAERKPTLSNIVGLYKSGVSRKIKKEMPECIVWQRSFHDHIIRNMQEYEKIWQYIQYNGQKWESDCFYPGIEIN